MNIPSPRELNLARFTADTYHGRHRPGWTWRRALWSLRRWLMHTNAALVNEMHTNIAALSRALTSLRAWRPTLRPKLTHDQVMVEMLKQGVHLKDAVNISAQRTSVPPRRTLKRLQRGASRRKVPARSLARPRGAHRLEKLITHVDAMDTRSVFVLLPLVRLQALANGPRVSGEPTWKESRHADEYAVV